MIEIQLLYWCLVSCKIQGQTLFCTLLIYPVCPIIICLGSVNLGKCTTVKWLSQALEPNTDTQVPSPNSPRILKGSLFLPLSHIAEAIFICSERCPSKGLHFQISLCLNSPLRKIIFPIIVMGFVSQR